MSVFLKIYLILAVLGLHCFEGFSLAVVSGGCSLILVRGFLVEVAFLVVEHRLSCLLARGIFPGQGVNPRVLRQQVDSQPPDRQGGPRCSALLQQL